MAEKSEIPRLWCSTRLNLAILVMLGCICFYSLRVNISFSVVCMVNHTAIAIVADDTQTKNASSNNTFSFRAESEASRPFLTKNAAADSCKTSSNTSKMSYQDGELLWDKEQQGLVLGSFFWGYILTNIVAGIIATKYGAKHVIGGALFCAAILTALTPSAARHSVAAVVVVRIVIGICLGCISPALHALWANWAPPQESSKLRSISFAGSQMGYVITFPITGLLCEYGFDGGWPSVFYLIAAFVMVWCLAWTLLVTNSPLEHPRIHETERKYIVSSLQETISMDRNRTQPTPWGQAFRSSPVWAVIVCHTCCNWGDYTFLTNIPTYMREVLEFDIKSNGFLSALPYICFWFVIIVSGIVADFLRRKQLLNTTQTRKFFNTLGTLLPASLLVGVGFLDCSHSTLAVTLLTLGIAMTGCLHGAGLHISFADLSPRHAGVLYGFSNTIATIPGFVAPIVIGFITRNVSTKSRKYQWRFLGFIIKHRRSGWVFFLAALIFIIGCVVFLLFGSGELQPWAMEVEEKTMGVTELCTPLSVNNEMETILLDREEKK